jgi:hypothetical protein
LRVVADENLGEGGLELFDMLREILTVFEIKFHLAAFLRRTRCCVTARPSIDENVATELLIDKNDGATFGNTGTNRESEGLVDHLFCGYNLGCLV